jgi:hypothetical protein
MTSSKEIAPMRCNSSRRNLPKEIKMSSHAIKNLTRKSMRSCSPSEGCVCGCGACFKAAGCECSQLAEVLDRGAMTAALYASSAGTKDLEWMVFTTEIEQYAFEAIEAWGIDAFIGRSGDASEATENRTRWEAAQLAGETWFHNAVTNPPREVCAPPVGQAGREAFIANARERMARGEIDAIGLGATDTEAQFGHLRGSGLNLSMIGL